jgi:hypothetical protein
MKKIKNEFLVKGLVKSAHRLGGLPIPPMAAIRVARLIRHLEGAAKDYEKVRKGILDEHFEPIPDNEGHMLIKEGEDKKAVEEKFAELAEQEFELPDEFSTPIQLNFSKWDIGEKGKYDIPSDVLKLLDETLLIEVK